MKRFRSALLILLLLLFIIFVFVVAGVGFEVIIIITDVVPRYLDTWWTTAAIQRCCETTPKDYTHHRRPLGDSCTRSTTVEAGHSQRKKPH